LAAAGCAVDRCGFWSTVVVGKLRVCRRQLS
jgi:hypothetical protein